MTDGTFSLNGMDQEPDHFNEEIRAVSQRTEFTRENECKQLIDEPNRIDLSDESAS